MSLQKSPAFTPYRQTLGAVEGGPYSEATFGRLDIETSSFNDLLVNTNLTGGAGTATVEVLVKSPQASGGFISQVPAEELAVPQGVAAFRVQPRGRRILLALTALTDASDRLSMEVAGDGLREELA